MKRIHEVIEYEHKGVEVLVKINHLKGQVSLVECNKGGTNLTDIKDKSWQFYGRGLDYMQGWQDILDAMKYAIAEATKILEADKEIRDKQELELHIMLTKDK